MDKPAKRKGSRKTVNAPNVEALGAGRLAAVLMDLADDLPVIKRRLRLELAAEVGPEDLAAELAKRVATYETRRSRIHWRRYREVVRELGLLRAMAAGPLLEKSPALALDLLWRILGLGPHLFTLNDDSRGELMALFRATVEDVAAAAAIARPTTEMFCERIVAALAADRHGSADALVEACAPALGAAGVAALRARLEAVVAAEPRARPVFREAIRVLADAQGDVEGFIATFPERDLNQPAVGAPIARRLLRAGRAAEALAALERSRPARTAPGFAPSASTLAWEEAHIDVLEAAGEGDLAQELRWAAFEGRLDAERLKAFLKRKPDFEDIEWEDRALALARRFPKARAALRFLVDWPALNDAAALVLERSPELEGASPELLDPAAAALEARHPLAAILLRRAMILDTLKHRHHERYPDIERWLDEAASLQGEISDWRGREDQTSWARSVAGRLPR